MGRDKSSNPTADFLIEASKMIDKNELRRVHDAIEKRLDEKPVIDLKPEKAQRDTYEEPKKPTNLLFNLLNNDTIAQLTSLFLTLGSSDMGSMFGKISGITSKPSREENLVAAIIPFLPEEKRSTLIRVKSLMRFLPLVQLGLTGLFKVKNSNEESVGVD